MTLVAVPITAAGPDAIQTALEAAQRAHQGGADAIEWRVDVLAASEEGRTAARELVDRSPLPCILTCRSADEGGAFVGDESHRITLLDELLEARVLPRWIDLEHVAWLGDESLRRTAAACRAQGTSLILSSHDFDGRPPDLLRRVAALGDADCDVIKIAYTARSLREALECADLLASTPKPMISLAMGPFGLISRIMAGAWGGLLTFAANDDDEATAPGQPTLDDLLNRYRFKSTGSGTGVFGLVGWPLGASPGFDRHNAMFRDADIDAVYLPLPVREGWERFKADVGALIEHPRIGFTGASVTMPHKADCCRFVQEAGGTLDEASLAAGAANTLTVGSDGALHGANTDVVGIVRPLEALGSTLAGARAAVLGAGGVARAACAGLLQAGASVRIFNRTASRGGDLARDLGDLGDIDSGGRGPFDVVVQCTSAGMAHGESAGEDPCQSTGFDPSTVAHGAAVLETVYDPVETPFVKRMRDSGAVVATGLDMWSAQAQAQQALWTHTLG